MPGRAITRACLLLVSALNLPVLAAVFDIPSQPLHAALKSFAKSAGVQVFASHKLTRDRVSGRLSGDLADEQAIARLLEGTGLGYKKLRPGVFVIVEKQTPAAPGALPADSEPVLEEVVITSRRREENLQHAPLSVTAFTAARLAELPLFELPELAGRVPNLTLVPSPPISGNSAATSVFLRGVGQLDFTVNVDPGVGTYVDGVYLARSIGGVIDLIDVERIEVLRGPQGTLFGRNSIGGAVRLMSKAPAAQPGGELSVTLGSDRRRDVQAVYNLPLTDTLRSKISVLNRRRDGYVIDGGGTDLGDDDSLTLRSQFLWQPHWGLSARLILDWTRDRENGSPNTPLTLFSSGQIPDRVNLAEAGEARRQGCTPALLDSSRQCFGRAWLTGDRRRTESTFAANSDNDIYGASLTLDYELEWGSLRSISAWRDLDSQFQRDSDHSPLQVFATVNDQAQDQVSQEFQLLGAPGPRQLDWVAGLYYFEESAREFTQVFLPAADGAPLTGLFDNAVENDNWALYGELTRHIPQRQLHVTLGTRYTEERKAYASRQVFAPADNPGAAIATLVDEPGRSKRFRELTSRVTLSYDWTPEVLAYLTYSEGFKSGGFNARHLAPAPGLRAVAYDPEYVTQYEAGIKFTAPDSGLRLNGAVFVSDYRDIQISTNPSFTSNATITQNAAEAKISGLELELVAAPGAPWLVEAGLGYINAAYRSLDEDVAIAVSNDFAWVPQWSGHLALSYTAEFDNGSALVPRIELFSQSEIQGTAENEPEVQQPGYSRLDLGMIYRDTRGRWSITLGVHNLTDRDYLISANENRAIGYAEGVFARGREWYLEVAGRF